MRWGKSDGKKSGRSSSDPPAHPLRHCFNDKVTSIACPFPSFFFFNRAFQVYLCILAQLQICLHSRLLFCFLCLGFWFLEIV